MLSPAHIGFAAGDIDTDAVCATVMFMVMPPDVTGEFVTQAALDVTLHMTICPFVNVVVEYVLELVPTGEAPTNH